MRLIHIKVVGLRTWLVVSAIMVRAATVNAFSTGIATTSFPVPAQGCNFCHSGGSTPSVMLECVDCGAAPRSVEPLSTHEFKLTVNEVGLQTHAGLNVSSVLGTLATGGAFTANTQTITGSGSRLEITHTAPKQHSGGVTQFSFLWTAPESSAIATLQAWGNAVNFNSNTSGDAASAVNLEVIVGDAPPPTATPTATATPAPAACPADPDPVCIGGFERAALLVKETTSGRERLTAKLSRGPALTQTDMGNPLGAAQGGTGTSYALCIYDGAGALAGTMIVDRAADTCGDKPCWRAVGYAPNDPRGAGRGYSYKDRSLSADGIDRLDYRAGTAGHSRATVIGNGANLPNGVPAALQASMQVTVQLRSSDGVCLTATLTEIRRQEPLSFQAR